MSLLDFLSNAVVFLSIQALVLDHTIKSLIIGLNSEIFLYIFGFFIQLVLIEAI